MSKIERISTAGMTQAEWEAARFHSIGGSDAAAVVGLSQYKSPYSLWAEKSGLVTPEDISQKEAVRLGHYLEDYVARRFSEETGMKVRRENYILKNPEYPFAHANVDRLLIGFQAGLECKTTSALNLKKFKGGEYPANYYVQCMHYMAITGYPVWYLAVLIGNSDFKIFRIDRDENEIKALMDAERAFWDCVETKTPPAIDGMKSTDETISAMYPGDSETPATDLTPYAASLREYIQLKAQVKELETRMDALANDIKAYMGNSTTGNYMGLKVIWKPVGSSRFDKKAFQRANPGIDLTPYHKNTVARRFEIKEA